MRFSTVVGALCLLLFVFFAVGYFFLTAYDLAGYDEASGLLHYELNLHDHLIYADTIERIRTEGLAYEFNNDIGIAALYVFLSNSLPFLPEQDFTVLALVFNLCTLIATYMVHSALVQKLGLGLMGKLSFFANTYLIYFTQLINKDLLTIFVLLLSAYLALRRQSLLLLLVFPLAAIVRQQLGLFVLLLAFFVRTSRPTPRILCMYVFTSVLAGVLSVYMSVIGEESLGEGFSSYLVNLNSQYYVGYLVFNPIRVAQYFYDMFSSVLLTSDSGGIDTAKLLRVPQLVLLACLTAPLLSLFYKYRFWLRSGARPLVLVVTAFFLAWLMNPTINARYGMLITPVLVLFGLYARRLAKVKTAL